MSTVAQPTPSKYWSCCGYAAWPGDLKCDQCAKPGVRMVRAADFDALTEANKKLSEALERLVSYNDCPDFANKLDREAQDATDGNVSAWEVLYDAARAALKAAKATP